jgi:hypothetical protein
MHLLRVAGQHDGTDQFRCLDERIWRIEKLAAGEAGATVCDGVSIGVEVNRPSGNLIDDLKSDTGNGSVADNRFKSLIIMKLYVGNFS